MITQITGLPGNGKTLYALAYINQWSKKDDRPVFYSGIADLKLPWTEIDPEKWYECPANSIIVIDECQRVFRMRSITKDVPEHVAQLETHRHKGLDIVLITQHPMLVDTAVRRLVGRHLHVIRKFGMQAATIHEWPSVRENCDKPAARKDSIKHHWKYDKEAFEFYKSAEVHTVKRSVPMRVYLLFLAPFLIGGSVWYMWRFAEKKAHPDKEKAVVTAPGQTSEGLISSGPSGAAGRLGYQNAVVDAKQFAFEHTSRVIGLPHTMPRYDEVTKPVTAPIPAACISSARGCRCYSQQGTLIQTPKALCEDIVSNGFFVDFEADRRRNDDVKVAQPEGNRAGREIPGPSGGDDQRITVLPNFTRPGSAAPAGQVSNVVPKS